MFFVPNLASSIGIVDFEKHCLNLNLEFQAFARSFRFVKINIKVLPDFGCLFKDLQVLEDLVVVVSAQQSTHFHLCEE